MVAVNNDALTTGRLWHLLCCVDSVECYKRRKQNNVRWSQHSQSVVCRLSTVIVVRRCYLCRHLHRQYFALPEDDVLLRSVSGFPVGLRCGL